MTPTAAVDSESEVRFYIVVFPYDSFANTKLHYITKLEILLAYFSVADLCSCLLNLTIQRAELNNVEQTL